MTGYWPLSFFGEFMDSAILTEQAWSINHISRIYENIWIFLIYFLRVFHLIVLWFMSFEDFV